MPHRKPTDALGLYPDKATFTAARQRLREIVNVKLAAAGFSFPAGEDSPLLDLGRSLLAGVEEKLRLYGDPVCPADRAIHNFLNDYLGSEKDDFFGAEELMVPTGALVLERHGLAREVSLPAQGDRFESAILTSSRVEQGVCHNPAKDRRTTEGVFHIAEGGLPIPADKKSVPKRTFAALLKTALTPPADLLRLPYTSQMPDNEQVRAFVSLLLRPMVCPEVPGVQQRRSMEIRFFAPGNLVSNLDFVETIFGNGGDPFLPENDARLDFGGWTGHTGCVILAPHLTALRKKDAGLPHISVATPRQIRDGMCWEHEDDLYNGGQAFKIACRDARGVCVTLIADSYYGYCKKEVKTQISFAANLMGQCEEEHAGGALAFPSFDLGEEFQLEQSAAAEHSWAETVRLHADLMTLHPDGYGTDRQYPDIIYLPENARVELRDQRISWTRTDGKAGTLKMLADHTYVLPGGYRLEMRQSVKGQRWRLVGTQAEGTFCHKPCTVSGGGKSEISKSLSDAMLTGPVIIRNLQEDVKLAEAVMRHDFGDRFRNPREPRRPSRALLDPSRSFGSVVRLLTPSERFTDEYNAWLTSIPRWVKELVLVVKRRYRADWGEDWLSRFSVDLIDGQPGIELKFRNQKLITRYLRVGFTEDGSWRTFGLRKDFAPAVKLQREDDITASVIIPAGKLSGLHPQLDAPAFKFAGNCEYRLFQRPDDAVIRGYDRVAEADFTRDGSFFSNYEPLPRSQAQEMVEDAIRFGQFTPPMQEFIRRTAKTAGPDYFVCTANPRIVDGKQTKNPRYLQNRPDLDDPRAEYLAEVAARLFRRLPQGKPALHPVHAVLAGRRNNPAEPGIRPLAVYGPIHWQDLPELFMDFIASLTGKSPSTTGAGSEGALTKGPFNCLLPVHDLNAALLSFILTGLPGYTTAAGYIGRKFRVDHDISLVVPEVWSRMHLFERDPEWLLEHGCLEAVRDFKHEGRTVEASRLGYRITAKFVQRFFGRVFSDPAAVFSEDMLRPEQQSMEEYVDGVENICDAHRKAALLYLEDGGIAHAIPPLRALLEIMATGKSGTLTRDEPAFRTLFTRESVLQSEWYAERLRACHAAAKSLCTRQAAALREFLATRQRLRPAEREEMVQRLAAADAESARLAALDPLAEYAGTLGTDPALSLPD